VAFKVGDWVFFEFELHQVQAVRDDGRVVELSDGLGYHAGYDLTDRCFAMTLPIKRISDAVRFQSDRIHREGMRVLNFPDIHRWLVEMWVQACQAEIAANDARVRERLDTIGHFTNDVLQMQAMNTGYGFPLLRGIDPKQSTPSTI